MVIAKRNNQDVVVFDLEGEIRRSDAPGVSLHQHVKEQLDSGKRDILLNFSKVPFIDSFGIGEILIVLLSAPEILIASAIWICLARGAITCWSTRADRGCGGERPSGGICRGYDGASRPVRSRRLTRWRSGRWFGRCRAVLGQWWRCTSGRTCRACRSPRCSVCRKELFVPILQLHDVW